MALWDGTFVYYKMDRGPSPAYWENSVNPGTLYLTSTTSWPAEKSPGKLNDKCIYNPDQYNAGLMPTDTDNSTWHMTNAMTISAWVKPYTNVFAGSYPMIVVRRAEEATKQFQLRAYSSSDHWLFSVSATGGQSWTLSSQLVSSYYNQWVHLVGIYDSAHTYLYVNGTENVTDSAFGNIIDPTEHTPFSIGGRLWQLGSLTVVDGFYGEIDEVGLWKRALSASEVAFLYNSGAGREYGDNGEIEADSVMLNDFTVALSVTSNLDSDFSVALPVNIPLGNSFVVPPPAKLIKSIKLINRYSSFNTKYNK